MITLKTRLILASQSPRRKSLLKLLEVPFEVHPSNTPEIWPDDLEAAEAVELLAHQKANEIAALNPNALVLGADTVVILDGEVLGKPESPADACAMLKRLSGRTHSVTTGLALIHAASGRAVTTHVTTGVTFAELTPEEIARYVDSRSPMDKAGSYGIQDDTGALFVRRIEGDYYNVVGLPVRCLYELLRTSFSDLVEQPS